MSKLISGRLYRYEGFKIILLCKFIAPHKTADRAFVSDHIVTSLFLTNYRLHHATTSLQAIARILINMPRPQAFRTMIRVTIAFHFPAAMAASEIFDGS